MSFAAVFALWGGCSESHGNTPICGDAAPCGDTDSRADDSEENPFSKNKDTGSSVRDSETDTRLRPEDSSTGLDTRYDSSSEVETARDTQTQAVDSSSDSRPQGTDIGKDTADTSTSTVTTPDTLDENDTDTEHRKDFDTDSSTTNNGTELDTSPGEPPGCGDDVASPDELCDGIDLQDNTCLTIDQGFTGGALRCNGTCDGWNTEGCLSEDPVHIVNDCSSVEDGYCEAPGGSSCRYIDAINGSDDNPGTFSAPWRTPVNVNTSIYYQYRPSTWVGLKPGDVVYLMEGVYGDVFYPGSDAGPTGGEPAVFHMQGVDGTAEKPIVIRNYPGQHAIIEPEGDFRGFHFYDCSYIDIRGLEIRNSYDRGIRFESIRSSRLSSLLIHDTDGKVEANVAGIELAFCRDIEINNSVLYNNYDREAAAAHQQTENSCNIVMFNNSGRIGVYDSVLFQTGKGDGQYSGCGLKYKHASDDPESSFEVSGCFFDNHKYYEVANATANAWVHHNVFHGGAGADYAYASLNLGGPVHQKNDVFEYNTIYGIGGYFVFPTTYDEDDTWDDLNGNVYQFNIMYDLTTRRDKERRPIQLSAYMSDDLYLESIDGFQFDSNCYFNPNMSMLFGFAEEGDVWGDLGGAYSLDEWQSTYGWDLNSYEVDPDFADVENMSFVPRAPECSDKGALADGNEVDTSKVYRILCEASGT